METCLSCGEEHGPTECRAALAVHVADALATHREDVRDLALLRLEVSDLRWQLQQATSHRFHA